MFDLFNLFLINCAVCLGSKKKKIKDFSSSIWHVLSPLFFREISLIFGEKYSTKVDDVMNKSLSSIHCSNLFLCLFLFLFFFLHLSSRYFCHKHFVNCLHPFLTQIEIVYQEKHTSEFQNNKFWEKICFKRRINNTTYENVFLLQV